MTNFLDFLSPSQALNVVFLIFAVGGIATSVYLYFRARQVIAPRYRISSTPLITRSIQVVKGLEVRHEGHPIENLTVTRVAFWNQGNATLEPQALAPSDPLRLDVSDGDRILQAAVEYSTKPANNVRVRLDAAASAAYLEFDYLHKGEGMVIQVFHTAPSPSAISLAGTVKTASIKRAEPLEDPITDSLIGPLFLRSMRWARRYGWWARLAVMVVLAPVTAITLPIDAVTKPMRFLGRTPREFDLSIERTMTRKT